MAAHSLILYNVLILNSFEKSMGQLIFLHPKKIENNIMIVFIYFNNWFISVFFFQKINVSSMLLLYNYFEVNIVWSEIVFKCRYEVSMIDMCLRSITNLFKQVLKDIFVTVTVLILFSVFYIFIYSLSF